jgi:hypothetical protein
MARLHMLAVAARVLASVVRVALSLVALLALFLESGNGARGAGNEAGTSSTANDPFLCHALHSALGASIVTQRRGTESLRLVVSDLNRYEGFQQFGEVSSADEAVLTMRSDILSAINSEELLRRQLSEAKSEIDSQSSSQASVATSTLFSDLVVILHAQQKAIGIAAEFVTMYRDVRNQASEQANDGARINAGSRGNGGNYSVPVPSPTPLIDGRDYLGAMAKARDGAMQPLSEMHDIVTAAVPTCFPSE